MLLFLLLSISLTYSLTPMKCGEFTPAKWFNLNTNDQITINFGVPSLNSEIVIPYLYGCRPSSAVSAADTITFGYNTQGLMTWSHASGQSVNVSYFQSDNNQDWWFFSATYTTNSAVSLNTFTDNDDRIVTIETSAYYQGGGPFHPPHHPGKNYFMEQAAMGGTWLRRNILAPLGDMNYYYQGPYDNLASTLNIAWNGIEQVTYTYLYSIQSSIITALNVSTQLFQDTPFYVNYVYHYTTTGAMDYYCVNTCDDAKIIFGYDSMGRLVNTTSGPDLTLLIQYDNNGNAAVVQSGGITWKLSY